MKANDHGYVRLMRNWKRDYEHRRVWIEANGEIPAGMKVHHINGNSSDNRLENLQLVTTSEHTTLHLKCYDEHGNKRCTICGEFKPRDSFSLGENGTMQGPCKPCKARYNRELSSRKSRKESSGR